MKRLLPTILLACSAGFAAEGKAQFHIEGLLGMPSISESAMDPKPGFGGHVGMGMRFQTGEDFFIRPSVGFEVIQHGMEFDFFDVPLTATFTSRFLTLGCGFEHQVSPALFLAFTPELDVSMGGKIKLEARDESEEDEIEGEENPFLLGVGFGYSVSEKAAITAAYKFAATPYLDGDDDTYRLNKVAVGVRFDL